MLNSQYRPRRIEDLYGQDRVREFLKTVTPENCPRSLIFYGPSGTGKTTSVRLLANKLWYPSEDGKDIDLEKAIDLNSALDYLEFSGVEYSGVNDMRELKERLMLSTFSGNLRIVAIDEAHGLSSKAFDALLKVTEESTHNIFVFLTTAFDKIPITIKTRSWIYEFSAPSSLELKPFIIGTSVKDGFKIEDEAAGVIAFKSAESYRAALNVLEPILISASAQKQTVIDMTFIEQFGGLITLEEIRSIKEFPNRYYRKGLLSVVELLQSLGNDPYELSNFSHFMYNVVRKGILNNQKSIDIKDSIFLKNLGELLSNKQLTLSKTALEAVLFKTIYELENSRGRIFR